MYSMCCALIDTDGSAFGLLGRDGSTIQLPADSDDVEIGRYETIETTLPSGSGGVDKGVPLFVAHTEVPQRRRGMIVAIGPMLQTLLAHLLEHSSYSCILS